MGRKKLVNGEKKSKMLTTKINEYDYNLIKSYLKQKNITLSNFIRKLVFEKIK